MLYLPAGIRNSGAPDRIEHRTTLSISRISVASTNVWYGYFLPIGRHGSPKAGQLGRGSALHTADQASPSRASYTDLGIFATIFCSAAGTVLDAAKCVHVQRVTPELHVLQWDNSIERTMGREHVSTGPRRVLGIAVAKADVDIPLPIAYDMWDDMEKIPKWMPWITSVKVIEEEPKRKSEWTLSTHQFGRDWEFSWVATNLTPVKYQKIHWTASEGLNNTGAIRFFKKPEKNKCSVSLTISYEIPQVLCGTLKRCRNPTSNTPFTCCCWLRASRAAIFYHHLIDLHKPPVALCTDMDRFAVYAKEYAQQFRVKAKK
eukprot:4582-Prorocentrum_minimum.AAC.2